MNSDLINKIHNIFQEKITKLPNNHHRDTMYKLSKYQQIIDLSKKIIDLQEDITSISNDEETNLDMIEMINSEVKSIQMEIDNYNQKLEDLILLQDNITSQNVLMEIRAGAGGDEASLFTNDLMKMYMKYGELNNWNMEFISRSENDIGIKAVVIFIKGKDVYNQLKNESGVHRVQRIPVTESNGRIHTSTCSISILPEQDSNINININTKDLQIDTYRASGAGGQHVNKTDSAVRITHIPSGIVVQCQQERSQHENKNRCMRELEFKLYQQEKEKLEYDISSKKQKQIGTSMRNEKIRTYNFPQNRITDHRYNITLYKLDIILTGQMEEFLQLINEAQKNKDLEYFMKTI